MAGSTRPSIKSVQRSLLFGVLVGVIFGCIVGAGLGALYAWRVNPAVYQAGALPNELAEGYQSHYLAVVIDSYILNRRVEDAQTRLQAFDEATKIRALGRWSAIYMAGGRTAEAQAVNELAVNLKNTESWNATTISDVVGELAAEYQNDSAKAQAITTFASQLGQVPLATPPEAAAPADVEPSPAEPAPAGAPAISWQLGLICCLGLILVAAIAFILYRRLSAKPKAPVKPEAVWEGEGPAPLKQWKGTYTFGQDNFDEFFTIETADGAFLGESGIGILESIPDTSPKQVVSFDVGLFDKTDITTLSRVVMSEHAFNDESIRAKVDANPQAEAVLAKPGETITLETSALRVEAKIEDMAYGEGGNVYFDRLKVALDVFVREGADLKIGTMDVPDKFKF